MYAGHAHKGLAGVTIKDDAVVYVHDNYDGIGSADSTSNNTSGKVEYSSIEGGIIDVRNNLNGINTGTISGGSINLTENGNGMATVLVDGTADITLTNHVWYQPGQTYTYYTITGATINSFEKLIINNNFSSINNTKLNTAIEVTGRGYTTGNGIKNSQIINDVKLSKHSLGLFFQGGFTESSTSGIFGGNIELLNCTYALFAGSDRGIAYDGPGMTDGIVTVHDCKYGIYTQASCR